MKDLERDFHSMLTATRNQLDNGRTGAKEIEGQRACTGPPVRFAVVGLSQTLAGTLPHS